MQPKGETAGEGTAGHTEIEAAALNTRQKSRLAKQAEAWIGQEQQRHDGRALIGRLIAGGTAADGAAVLDKANPDHRAAVDDYFENVVIPARSRVKGAATFIAATGVVPPPVTP